MLICIPLRRGGNINFISDSYITFIHPRPIKCFEQAIHMWQIIRLERAQYLCSSQKTNLIDSAETPLFTNALLVFFVLAEAYYVALFARFCWHRGRSAMTISLYVSSCWAAIERIIIVGAGVRANIYEEILRIASATKSIKLRVQVSTFE